MTTPHETLGVSPDATAEEIRKAYRKKSKAVHPDTGGDPVAFLSLTIAYKEAMGEETQPRNAMPIVSRMYDEIMISMGDGIYFVDIEAEIVARCRRDIKTIETQHDSHNALIAKFKRLNKRCAPDSIIKGINDGMIKEYGQSQRRMRAAIVELEEAIELVRAGCKFTPEPRPEPEPERPQKQSNDYFIWKRM